jgi:hypothetical protein
MPRGSSASELLQHMTLISPPRLKIFLFQSRLARYQQSMSDETGQSRTSQTLPSGGEGRGGRGTSGMVWIHTEEPEEARIRMRAHAHA